MPGHFDEQTLRRQRQDSLEKQVTGATEAPENAPLWALAGDQRSRNGMTECSLFHLPLDPMNNGDDAPVDSSSAS